MINDDEINEFSPAEGGDDSVKEFNPYSEFLNDDEPSETSVASETGGEEHLTTESDIELPDFLRTTADVNEFQKTVEENPSVSNDVKNAPTAPLKNETEAEV